MLVPIAIEAKNRGHEVCVAAEGAGVFLWFQAGLKPFFIGAPSSDIIAPVFDAGAFLKNVRPDAILMEFPFSVNIAKDVGLEANKRGIPVILIEDYWAVSKRLCGIRLDLILTIDEYAKKIAEETTLWRIPVKVIGNHAVSDIKKYSTPDKVLEILSEARRRFDELFVYIGGNVAEADLKLLVSSLLLTPGNWGLIPCYHPNYKDRIEDVSGKKCFEIWDELLDPIHNRIVRCDSGTSDDLAILADACFSAFGSSVSTAIRSGKPAVILSTPESDAALKKVNLEEVPWLALGAVGIIKTPQNIRPFLTPASEEVRNKFIPLNPKKAADYIEDFLLSIK
ncbi:MAG: hypothetical protein Q7K35_02085 [bacterium]|nr:hypothetical protein [bacterium]